MCLVVNDDVLGDVYFAHDFDEKLNVFLFVDLAGTYLTDKIVPGMPVFD